MNNIIFHNNFHRSNHHTVSLLGYPESAKDAIASLEFPFRGIFYNSLYSIDNDFIANTNSYDWHGSYTIVNPNSATWEKCLTTYTTVRSNSSFWDESYTIYSSFKSLSSNYQSTFLTLCANLNYWNAVYDDNTMYTNKVQEYTRQKTFVNNYIYPSNPMNIVLDLSGGQVTTYITDVDSHFSDFSGNKKGGIYHLILITDATSNPTLQVSFNSSKFKFSEDQNTFSIGGIHLRKIQFVSDGQYLHGKTTLYQIPTPAPTPSVTPSVTPTPTPTPSNNQVITFVNGNPVVLFGSNDNLAVFSVITPTPTPIENIITFINGENVIRFGGDEMFLF